MAAFAPGGWGADLGTRLVPAVKECCLWNVACGEGGGSVWGKEADCGSKGRR
jgi:hypothetical protein